MPLEKANAELSRLARTDSLTSLANRRTLGEFLSAEWESCSRKSEPIALLMIDIDFFKRYNDTYGHQAGDDVLRKVSNVISDELEGSTMLAARYGGDEFSGPFCLELILARRLRIRIRYSNGSARLRFHTPIPKRALMSV